MFWNVNLEQIYDIYVDRRHYSTVSIQIYLRRIEQITGKLIL